MKPQELRIGNYVLMSGEPIAINSTFICDYYYWMKNPERQDAVSFENVEPIPLTEQWLKDFGFRNYDGGKWDTDEMLLIKYDDGCIYFSGPLHVHIFYVHQLQNLYFALTGKELTK